MITAENVIEEWAKERFMPHLQQIQKDTELTGGILSDQLKQTILDQIYGSDTSLLALNLAKSTLDSVDWEGLAGRLFT